MPARDATPEKLAIDSDYEIGRAFMLENDLVHVHMRDLTGAAWKVYCALKAHFSKDNPTVFPGNRRLAQLTGISARHVRNGLSELLRCRRAPRCAGAGQECGHGLIVREQRARQSSLIRFNNPTMLVSYPRSAEVEAGCHMEASCHVEADCQGGSPLPEASGNPLPAEVEAGCRVGGSRLPTEWNPLKGTPVKGEARAARAPSAPEEGRTAYTRFEEMRARKAGLTVEEYLRRTDQQALASAQPGGPR